MKLFSEILGFIKPGSGKSSECSLESSLEEPHAETEATYSMQQVAVMNYWWIRDCHFCMKIPWLETHFGSHLQSWRSEDYRQNPRSYGEVGSCCRIEMSRRSHIGVCNLYQRSSMILGQFGEQCRLAADAIWKTWKSRRGNWPASPAWLTPTTAVVNLD